MVGEPYTQYPDHAPPLQDEVEEPPAKKELIPGVIYIINFTPPC
jgi:hypothetical protein